MKIDVRDNEAVLIEQDRLVSGAVKMFRAEFTFDASWDGFTRTAVFNGGTVSREAPLVEDACMVPWEVLLPNGHLSVGVYGINGAQVKPTTYCEKVRVYPGAREAEPGMEPTPDVYQKILNAIEGGKLTGPAGIGLPAVTEADNGKFARVADGGGRRPDQPGGRAGAGGAARPGRRGRARHHRRRRGKSAGGGNGSGGGMAGG